MSEEPSPARETPAPAPTPARAEVAFETPWFKIEARRVEGEAAPYYILCADDCVSVLAQTVAGSYLLIRQLRPALRRVTLEFPAGNVDPGETPAQAAARELEEETGYRAEVLESLGACWPDPGRVDCRQHCFLARGARKVTEPEAGIELVELSPAELVAAIKSGELGHALHLAHLLLRLVTQDELLALLSR